MIVAVRTTDELTYLLIIYGYGNCNYSAQHNANPGKYN